MAGLPVTITSGGLPVTVTGAGAASIPISAIGVPAGAVGDQSIVTNAAGTALVAGPGFFSNVLFATHIPFIIASSGSIGNNGALSGLTALPTTYANAYIYIPAGGIAAGVPAAATWYYVTMSSTTAGTIFNNTYTSGQPTIPSSPTAFVTTGPGAFTGVSSNVVGYSYSMPAATMGLRDTIRLTTKHSVTNTASAKNCIATFGGSTLFNVGLTTTNELTMQDEISNRDSTAIQVAAANSGTGSIGASGTALQYLTVDTTSAVVIAISGTNGTPATNNIILESVIIEILKGA